MYQAAVAAGDAALAERSLLQIVRIDTTNGKCLEQLADCVRTLSLRHAHAIVDEAPESRRREQLSQEHVLYRADNIV